MTTTAAARLVAGVALVLAVSGCAGASAAVPAPTGAPPAAGAPASTTPPAGSVATVPGEVVVDGVAHRGAMPSCVTFTALDGRRFVLLGPAVPVEVPVTVRGVPEPDSASYCNAGTPMRVSSATPR